MRFNINRSKPPKCVSVEEYDAFSERQQDKFLNTPSLESGVVTGALAVLVGAVIAGIATVISRLMGNGGTLEETIDTYKETASSAKEIDPRDKYDDLVDNKVIQGWLAVPIVHGLYTHDNVELAWKELIEWTLTANREVGNSIFNGMLASTSTSADTSALTESLSKTYGASSKKILDASSKLLAAIEKTALVPSLTDDGDIGTVLNHINDFSRAAQKKDVYDEKGAKDCVRSVIDSGAWMDINPKVVRFMENVALRDIPEALLDNAKQLEKLQGKINEDMSKEIQEGLKELVQITAKVDKISANVLMGITKSFKGCSAIVKAASN